MQTMDQAHDGDSNENMLVCCKPSLYIIQYIFSHLWTLIMFVVSQLITHSSDNEPQDVLERLYIFTAIEHSSGKK